MGDDRLGRLLKIVRRQRVGRLGDEGLEEAPGPARCQPQGVGIGIRQGRLPCRQPRTARPPRDHRRRHPGDGEARRQRPGPAVHQGGGRHGAHPHGDAAGHSPEEAEDPGVRAARLRHRRPLEEVATADRDPPERAQDRIGHQPGLVAEEDHHQGQLGERQPKVAGQGAQVGDDGHPRVAAELAEHRNQWRQGHGRKDEGRPDRGGVPGGDPARDEGGHEGRSRQRAAQIIQHLPAADRRHAVAQWPQHPGQELPVAPDPAMVAARRDIVPRREILHDLHVRRQSGSGEDALEEVVAEHGGFGHPASQGGFEGVDVVDALTRVGAFTEQVLVDVGDGGGIGIDARRAREHS